MNAPAIDLILASTSTYRRAQLGRLGVPFRVRDPGVDETSFKSLSLPPIDLAVVLATAKATRLAPEEPNATILGGDQLVAFDGAILGKPGNASGAVKQLRRLAGRTHELVTAIAVWRAGEARTHVDVARLTMRELTSEELERYVAADQPIDCAGAYKLESRGIALFSRIECADHSAITGLPLIALASMLRDLGAAIP